ncbi:MAG: hypothetical protein ABSG78_07040 [Verrucomicrobiota bacterium]
MKPGENFWWCLLLQAPAFAGPSAFAKATADESADKSAEGTEDRMEDGKEGRRGGRCGHGGRGGLPRTPLDSGPTLAI